MRPRRGFTLLELIVAMTLSSFVLVGIVTVAAQMMRSQIESSDKGEVTGWTLIGLNRMNKELQDANYLAAPNAGGGAVISGCINYSMLMNNGAGGPINAALPTTAFYYCVNPAVNCGQPGVSCNLLRYYNDGVGIACPIAPTCGNAAYGLNPVEVVSRYVSQIQTPAVLPYFQRANDVGGIALNFNVGTTSPSANRPNPVFLTISTKIKMNKQYGNTTD